MKFKDYALTPVVSSILAALIVTSTIGTILVWGVPYTDSLNSEAIKENVVSQIGDISDEIKALTGSTPGDKKANTYSFGGGSLSVSDDYDRTVLMYSHDPNYEFTVTDIGVNSIIFKMLNPSTYLLNDATVSWSTCFLAGTKVLMADGSYKNIDDITVGEQVASYNEYTKTMESDFVSKVFHHPSAEMPDYYIIINKDLKVTPNHWFYSEGKWTYAADLKIGDNLFSQDGSDYYIYSLERVYEKEPCFDLEIEQHHTYFVSFVNDGVDVLVHNLPPAAPSNFKATALDRTRISLTWTKASGTNIYTYIVAKINSYPTSRTDGTNIYNNTGTSFTHMGLSPGQHWYYRAWSWNATGRTWSLAYASANTSTFTNNLPSYGAPTPANGSNNQPLSLTWQININDIDGDQISWTIQCSNRQQNSGNNQPGGTKSLSISGLSYSKTYNVWVNSTDGYGWTRKWYTFTTAPLTNQPPSKPINPQPSNHATNVSINVILEWSPCIDPEGRTVYYEVYFGFKTLERNPMQEETWFDPGTLNYNAQYWWKVIAYDEQGEYTESDMWDFATEDRINNPPNVPVYSSPSNLAIGVSITPTLRWNCSDPDGDPLTYDIYFTSINPPHKVASDWPVNSYSVGTLQYNTTYYWKIVAKDDKGAIAGGIVWRFTTISLTNSPPNMPNNPTPTNDETNVELDTNLIFNGGDPDLVDTIVYTAYFGTTNPPNYASQSSQLPGSQTVITIPPPTLTLNTTYYWKIVAQDNHGATTTGPIWKFTTATNNPPNIPSNPNPENESTDVWVETALSWAGGDPDGDYLTYDFYFGTNSSPPFNRNNGNHTTLFPLIGRLEYNTKYYWKIIAIDEYGATTAGPIWEFTTESEDSITVLSPNGGETWCKDSKQYITWSSIGLKESDEVTIMLINYFEVPYGLAVVPNSGSYKWDLDKLEEGGYLHIPGYYKILIKKSNGHPYDLSDNFFTIYPAGSYILTIQPPENVTYQAAIFTGMIKNLSGSVRFRYRQNGSTSWIYPSDWHGNYTNGIFKETVDELLTGVKYEYQAGVKPSGYELWGNSCYFTTNIHEGFVNQINISSNDIRHNQDDTWLIKLSFSIQGTVVVDLYADGIRFGTIWIFDSNSLVYTRTDRDVTDSYVLEKNGIISYLGGELFVTNTPQIYNSNNLFSINVVRTLFSSFSKSASYNDMLKFELYSTLQSSYIGETKKVYNLRLQFNGDYASEWGNYLREKASFILDNEQTSYESLKYINPTDVNNGINLALAHSVVDLRLEP